MKIMKALLGSMVLAALPLGAQAQGMSYSYVDVGYVDTDIDGLDESADGFGVRGSVGFAENFFLFAEYASQEADVGGVDVDVDQIAIGFGGHLSIADNVDLVGRLGYIEADVDAGAFGSADDDGYLVSAGLRGQVAEGFELEGHVIHTDFGGSSGDDTAFSFGGRYFFTDNFAVGAEYQAGDDADTILVGVRFKF